MSYALSDFPHARLTVYVGEQEYLQHRPLHRAIVERLHELGVAGVTVTRGIEGYGAGRHIHLQSILRLSVDLPVTIEAVDTREKLEGAVAALDAMVTKGLVTMEPVVVCVWRPPHGLTNPTS